MGASAAMVRVRAPGYNIVFFVGFCGQIGDNKSDNKISEKTYKMCQNGSKNGSDDDKI